MARDERVAAVMLLDDEMVIQLRNAVDAKLWEGVRYNAGSGANPELDRIYAACQRLAREIARATSEHRDQRIARMAEHLHREDGFSSGFDAEGVDRLGYLAHARALLDVADGL